ncbi:hypothetical protein [Streptomyces sp. NRRL F-5123]|uniref:hypothetical protein n=1 Tax=Streptomyces sp. NRRL F-5123 TaxID=1463856 RepID=UPI0004E1F91C|nr:hypothetical protein [Streptomyces sp. NRRL F-5123]
MARGCAFTAIGAVGVVFALLVCGAWYINEQLKPVPPPDVAAFAHSAPARAARAGAARSASADTAALAAALPGAEPLGTSVSDVCRSLESGAMFGGRSSWGPVQCTRATVAYVAFDGDIAARLRALDAVLAARGWTGSTLTEAAASPDRTALPPSPTESFSPPHAAPTGWGRVSGKYARPPHRAAGYDTSASLQVSVAGAPYDPETAAGYLQLGDEPLRRTESGLVHVTWQPLSTHAVAQEAFVTHHYVAAFSVVVRYIVQSPPATPTKSPTPTTYDPGPCLSGSHTCS